MYLSNSVFLFAISFPSQSIMKVSSSSWPLIWRMTSQRNCVSTSLPPSRARQGAALLISLMENPVYWVGHCATLPFVKIFKCLFKLFWFYCCHKMRERMCSAGDLLNVNMLVCEFTHGALTCSLAWVFLLAHTLLNLMSKLCSKSQRKISGISNGWWTICKQKMSTHKLMTHSMSADYLRIITSVESWISLGLW